MHTEHRLDSPAAAVAAEDEEEDDVDAGSTALWADGGGWERSMSFM